jgi:quercetin dioxygenase-like cupin family protein
MELKHNDATRNRPEGTRVIDGTQVMIDIPGFTDQLLRENAWEKSDRNGITVFKSENMTMVISALRKGAEMENNSIDAFLSLQVLKGKLSVTSTDGATELEESQILVLHPEIENSVRALKDSFVLLTTYNPKH